jgi:NAD(P)H-hydrate epimerase
LRGISRQEAREVDRRAWEDLGIPSLLLMENAGAGAARIALERWCAPGAAVVCLCGPGQNGGDGLVLARHVAVAGASPRILLLGAPDGGDPPGDAGTNLRICRAMGLPTVSATTASLRDGLSGASVVVDALFGTGLRRPLQGLVAELVAALTDCAAPVLALDTPSGLDCDTGEPLGPCVRADVTATFAAPKLGFARAASRRWTGEVVVVPIGAPVDSRLA